MSANNQTDNNKRKLSDEQKQKIKKYAVFALMGIICAGCMWFIFAPSADKKAKQEQLMGFNADIPMPKNESIIGNKRDAYEQEQMKQKQAERMRSLDDFGSLLSENSKKQSDNLTLLPDESSPTKTGNSAYSARPVSVQNSMNAYHDINRTLGNFYEKPREDPEKEQLKQELEELKSRLDETDNGKKAMDDQLALMEKSFQMASKYIPMSGGAATAGGTTEQAATNTAANISGKTAITPVWQFVEQTVSALPQELPEKDAMQAFAQPRNMVFHTVTAEASKEWKNTISACVHDNQTIMDGKSVRLRLTEPILAGKVFIRENTILSGFAKIQGERLQISIYSLEYNGNIIPVEIFVYDTDGQRGIFIPDTEEINAAKEIAANMGTNAGTSINLSNDAGEQFVADMGRNVIQGVSQLFSKKLREVKVNLKAGYRVFLVANPQ